MRRAAAIALASALAALVPAAPASAPVATMARARAWALRISAPGADVIELAGASSETGRAPHATAAPVAVAGTSPQRATATPDAPEEVVAPLAWTDPSASMTLTGGFAEAHAAPDTTSATAGVGSGTGSGFAMASRLFTEEQQTALLTQWLETNEALFLPINDTLARLGPALALAGLAVPTLEPMPPVGFVDVALVKKVSSSTSTSSGAGISSARAETAASDVRLFAGFIEARGVHAVATSESVDGAATLESTATVSRLKIAGVEVVADSRGIRTAGSGLLDRTVVQPALDILLDALAQAGLVIRAADARGTGNLREATVLEVSLTSPQGVLSISIGHAEAEAPPLEPLAPAPPPPVVSQPAPPVLPPQPGTGAAVVPETPPASSPPVTTAAAPAPSRRSRHLPPAVARALRTSYLLLVVGALIGALVLPMIGRPALAPARSRPLIRPRTRGGTP